MKKLKKEEPHRYSTLWVKDNLDIKAPNLLEEDNLLDGPKAGKQINLIQGFKMHDDEVDLFQGFKMHDGEVDLFQGSKMHDKEIAVFDGSQKVIDHESNFYAHSNVPCKKSNLVDGSSLIKKNNSSDRFNRSDNESIDVSCEDDLLKGFIDTHIHTAPDVKPRLLNDVEAAISASIEGMHAIIIKSHLEPTSGRARIAEAVTGFKVFGGVCLNESVGGLNGGAVKTAASLGGKFVWLPTVSYSSMKLDVGGNIENLEEIINLTAEHNMVLATGHLKACDIFSVIDMARSIGLNRLVVNHPLTGVVGASVDEQKEMSRHAYMEHCFVACMPGHDELDPAVIADAIREVGPSRCIMATDFGQAHNPTPVQGMKMFVSAMLDHGISIKEIRTMCIENPSKLLF